MSTDKNKKFVRKELCDERHNNINGRFKDVEAQLEKTEEKMNGINNKITATLVFVIVTLLTLLIQTFSKPL